jgi:hypothetical protein
MLNSVLKYTKCVYVHVCVCVFVHVCACVCVCVHVNVDDAEQVLKCTRCMYVVHTTLTQTCMQTAKKRVTQLSTICHSSLTHTQL